MTFNADDLLTTRLTQRLAGSDGAANLAFVVDVDALAKPVARFHQLVKVHTGLVSHFVESVNDVLRGNVASCAGGVRATTKSSQARINNAEAHWKKCEDAGKSHREGVVALSLTSHHVSEPT